MRYGEWRSVAEQLYKGELRSVEAFNSAITKGRYVYSGNIPDSELGTNTFGVVEVIPANAYIFQVIYGIRMISFRISYDKGINWSDWTSVGV